MLTSTDPKSRSTLRVKITGLYPRVRVDTSATAAVGQAGGVLLIRTVAVTGLDRAPVGRVGRVA